MSSLGGQNAAVGSEGGTVHTQHAPTRFGWCRGLVVGGGIGGANGTGGGGDQGGSGTPPTTVTPATTAPQQDQRGEVEKLKAEVEKLKKQALKESNITTINLVGLRNEMQMDYRERTKERKALERRVKDLKKELAKQASLQITPAERASVALLKQQVPALESRIVPLEKDVPAMHATLTTLVTTVGNQNTQLTRIANTMQQGGGRGGATGGATGGGARADSWADWKTQGCAILGVRTASQNRAPNRYDCYDQNCPTKYFDKEASLLSYVSHVVRIHHPNFKQNPLAAYLPRGRV